MAITAAHEPAKQPVPAYELRADELHQHIGRLVVYNQQLAQQCEALAAEVNEWHDRFLAKNDECEALRRGEAQG